MGEQKIVDCLAYESNMRPEISKIIQNLYQNIKKKGSKEFLFNFDRSENEKSFNMRMRKELKNAKIKILNEMCISFVSDLNPENYILLEFLGRGEFGIVYKAFDKNAKRFIAFKQLELDKDIILKKECFDEGLILKKLSLYKKKRFLEFFGAFTFKENDNEKLWLVMQCGEAALSDILEYRKQYTDPEIIFIISTIMDSLKEAKTIGISHGDLKLADVVILKENGEYKYKLIDIGFGIGIQLEEKKENNNNERKKVRESKIKGFSPLYASPELLKIFSQQNNTENMVDVFKIDRKNNFFIIQIHVFINKTIIFITFSTSFIL